jgi:hypothetical protein
MQGIPFDQRDGVLWYDGKLVPWRFIVFQGEARERAGDILAAAFAAKEPDAEPSRIAAERRRMTMAPLIVAVVSCAAPHVKIPEWEQELTAGAVCMNLLIGAKAMGYAGSWLTNWFSYDHGVLARFGVAQGGPAATDRRANAPPRRTGVPAAVGPI